MKNCPLGYRKFIYYFFDEIRNLEKTKKSLQDELLPGSFFLREDYSRAQFQVENESDFVR